MMFFDLKPNGYWSGTGYAGSMDDMWSVDFTFGHVRHSNKDLNLNVWPVRGGH